MSVEPPGRSSSDQASVLEHVALRFGSHGPIIGEATIATDPDGKTVVYVSRLVGGTHLDEGLLRATRQRRPG